MKCDARFSSPHYQSIRPISNDTNATNTTIPVPVRRPLGSIPEDLNEITEPVHSSSGNKRKNTDSSLSVIESSQQAKKKNREHT